jgi:TonB family protein
MGYQALLFCPDEKTARSVTQVLSELDFTVTPCTEPFGAVKKLMGEHFDAVVVDCDNEQNATLLFKSARNTPNNQSALAVAVVEGQAGVAKAFRIGANLVLTKPINVEQAKGTLRVARGLLRKNEAGKPAAPAAATTVKPVTPAPPKPTPQAPTTKVVATRQTPPVSPLGKTATASIPAQRPSQPKVVASVPADDESDAEILDIDEIVSPSTAAPGTKIAASESDVLSPTPTMGVSAAGSSGFGSGAASAPAPAREAKPKTDIPEPESPAEKAADSSENIPSNDGTSAPAPAFTFGGNVSDGGKAARGGNKKMLLVAAAVVLVAAGGYALWMQWVGSSGAATPFTHVAAPVTKPAVVPQATPSKAPVGASSSVASSTVPTTSSASASSPATSSVASPVSDSAAALKGTATVNATSDSDEPSAESADEPVHPSKGATKGDSAKPSAPASTANKAPATKEAAAAAPIVIKNGHSQAVAKPAPTPDAPSITGIAPVDNGGSLPNLMGGDSRAPAPVLQMLSVSQGVSRGLLVKKTQPVYPASAMQMHIEGTVELQATISKSGDIAGVKIISGDARLARAAVDAVKQWKYKPYLLNGEPIEIQTQITMNFKLP